MSYPDPFDDILHGSLLRTAATPPRDFGSEECEIRIAALGGVPSLGRDDGYAHIPLCGHVTVSGADPGGGAPLAFLCFVATRTSGAISVGGLDVRRRTTTPDPSSIATHYFNVDLAETLELPPTPAVYFVYAFLGPYVSNVVRIEVVDPDEAAP